MKKKTIIAKLDIEKCNESNLYKHGQSIRLSGYNSEGLKLSMVAHPIKLIARDIKDNKKVLDHEHFFHRILCDVADNIIKVGNLIEIEYIEGKIDLHNETVLKQFHVIYFNEFGVYKGINLIDGKAVIRLIE